MKICHVVHIGLTFVVVATSAAAPVEAAARAPLLKSCYLDVMEAAVGAYTPERTADYVRRVEKDMIKEHGFHRLTANIGVLLAHGRLADKKGLFHHMMDLCCRQIPVAYVKNGGAVRSEEHTS